MKWKEILLIFISLVFSLLMISIFLEIYYYTFHFKDGWLTVNTQFDPELGWATIPNETTTVNNKSYTTNSFGFRSPEVDMAKKHILIIGDSVAWGFGVSDDETLSYYLGKKLKSFQVLNLGVSGYGITQYYLNLKRNIDKVNPEMVIIVITTGNDLGDDMSYSRSGKSKPLFIYKENYTTGDTKLIRTNDKISRYSCVNLFSKSFLLSQAFFSTLKSSFCKPRNLIEEHAKLVITSFFEKFSDLSRKYGFELLFVISPEKNSTKIRSKDELSKILRTNSPPPVEVYGRLSYDYFLKILDQLNYNYVDFFNELVIKRIDIDKLYLENDGTHYSKLGNKNLAETIFRNINTSVPESLSVMKQ